MQKISNASNWFVKNGKQNTLKQRKCHWSRTEVNSLRMAFKTNKDNIFAANQGP